MKQCIVVTGANGQLGSEFQDIVDREQHDWIFLSRKEMDLEDPVAMRAVLATISADVIIHCAAYTAVDKAEEDRERAAQINHHATALLAEYCQSREALMIYYSSDYVYHSETGTPLRESALTTPQGVYAQTKLDGENAVRKLSRRHAIFRTSWVYSSHGHNFVHTMMRLMQERDSLSIVADQIGAPTYARVIAEATIAALPSLLLMDSTAQDDHLSQTYNLCNGGSTSWHGFAREIREQLGLTCELQAIPSSDYPTPAARPEWSVMDCSKLEESFPSVRLPHWRNSLTDCLRLITEQRADDK